MNPAERRTYGARLRQLKKIKRECTLCCRLMDVDELDKPADKWCEHCQVGTGCRIYEDRPKTCRGWSCQWLARPDRYPEEELRPDRCSFLLDITKNDRGWFLVVGVDYGDPADEQTWPPRLRPFLDQLAERGAPIVVKFIDDGRFITSATEEQMRSLWPALYEREAKAA
jgi:hypothetical protein